MQYQVELSDEAKLNINEASKYYSKVSTSLNQKFKGDLIETINRLSNNTLHYQVLYKKIRIAHTKIFPFGIHFIIEINTVYVLKILHHKQYYK